MDIVYMVIQAFQLALIAYLISKVVKKTPQKTNKEVVKKEYMNKVAKYTVNDAYEYVRRKREGA